MAQEALGQLIRRVRRERGFTQAQLADMIGVKDSYITKIECGKQRGSYETLAMISEALKIPWDDVMKAGQFAAPYMYNANSFFPLVDQQLTKFHPKIKLALIDIGNALKTHMPYSK